MTLQSKIWQTDGMQGCTLQCKNDSKYFLFDFFLRADLSTTGDVKSNYLHLAIYIFISKYNLIQETKNQQKMEAYQTTKRIFIFTFLIFFLLLLYSIDLREWPWIFRGKFFRCQCCINNSAIFIFSRRKLIQKYSFSWFSEPTIRVHLTLINKPKMRSFSKSYGNSISRITK